MSMDCCTARCLSDRLTVWACVKLGEPSPDLEVLCRVCLVVGEGIEQRGLCRGGLAGFALEAVLHAVVEDGVEGALVDAVTDGQEVLDHAALVGRGRGCLWWGSFLSMS
jgi:hypothetical protein